MFWDHQVVNSMSKVNHDIQLALWNYDRISLESSDVEAIKWLHEPERGKWSWTIVAVDAEQVSIDSDLQTDQDYDSLWYQYDVRWSFEKLDDALMFKLIWC